MDDLNIAIYSFAAVAFVVGMAWLMGKALGNINNVGGEDARW